MDKDRNLLTVRRENGKEITYDPKRLRGVNVYQQEERQFAKGDRIQFTAPFKAANIANRELARIESIDLRGICGCAWNPEGRPNLISGIIPIWTMAMR